MQFIQKDAINLLGEMVAVETSSGIQYLQSWTVLDNND